MVKASVLSGKVQQYRLNKEKIMRVTVEVTEADLAEMKVTEDQLEEAVRNELGCLNVGGDALYLNDLTVSVVINEVCVKKT